jgi:sensor domain CHASE-containing protein
MNNMTTKNLSEIAGFNIDSIAPRYVKESIVDHYLDTSKYEFIGFIDRTNTVVLQERYYNVRDNNGRFARVKESR